MTAFQDFVDFDVSGAINSLRQLLNFDIFRSSLSNPFICCVVRTYFFTLDSTCVTWDEQVGMEYGGTAYEDNELGLEACKRRCILEPTCVGITHSDSIFNDCHLYNSGQTQFSWTGWYRPFSLLFFLFLYFEDVICDQS